MSKDTVGVIGIELDACAYAFEMGQILESLLLERGLNAARESQSRTVTISTIQSCVDPLLLEDLRKQLDERAKQHIPTAA